MKKFIFMLLAAAMVGCAKNDVDREQTHEVQQIEEYMPGVEKETYVTTKGVVMEKLDSVYIIQGDILLSREQAEEFELPETKGTVLNNGKYMWPDGIVYFCFANEGLSYRIESLKWTQTEKLYEAMNYYHRTTGIEFRPVTYAYAGRSKYIVQPDYIEFIDGDGNWSKLGRQGGRQQLCLSPTGASVGTAMHELGHAIGLLHEQCRRDRDNYININFSNIQSEKRHNFEKTNDATIMGTFFDFNSIMLYGSYNLFAIDLGKPTMTKKDGSTWVAQRSYLSAEDLNLISTKYPKAPCNVVLKVNESDNNPYRRH